MKFRVIYSPGSRRDLDGLSQHIARESGSVEIARNYVGRILDACDALADGFCSAYTPRGATPGSALI